MSNKAEVFLAAVRAMGSDAADVRDAAHEAHHALTSGLKQTWTRDRIHDALMDRFERVRANLWLHEIEARVVEQIICKKLKVKTEPLDHWLAISAMEAIKFHLPYTHPAEASRIARQFQKQAGTAVSVKNVLFLAEAKS